MPRRDRSLSKVRRICSETVRVLPQPPLFDRPRSCWLSILVFNTPSQTSVQCVAALRTKGFSTRAVGPSKIMVELSEVDRKLPSSLNSCCAFKPQLRPHHAQRRAAAISTISHRTPSSFLRHLNRAPIASSSISHELEISGCQSTHRSTRLIQCQITSGGEKISIFLSTTIGASLFIGTLIDRVSIRCAH